MEQEELKRKLMGLWEKTTHNSKELVATLFDYYFDMDLIEYKEIDGKVVSALFGIPYFFGSAKHNLKGLYLISLSSEEGYRKKGVLAELLNNFNDRIKEDYDLSFIVPHTELLADYYGSQGYLSSFFILEERYTPLHDFKNDYILSLTDSDERIRELKIGLLDEIKVVSQTNDSIFTIDQVIQFIQSIEKKKHSSVNLLHTPKDLEYIMHDQNLRDLSAFIAFDTDYNITGVAFTQKEELKRIKVVAHFVSDACSYFALLDHIKHKNPDFSISVITSDPQYQTHSIIQQTYVSENPAGPDLDNTFSTVEIAFNINKLLQPLGMVRLLNYHNIIEYIAATRSDVDFKLHIRDTQLEHIADKLEDDMPYNAMKGGNHEVFIVKNGKCKIETFKDLQSGSQILNLTRKEVAELLLRKKDSSNLIMEAFGIPRLNLQMTLLPY